MRTATLTGVALAVLAAIRAILSEAGRLCMTCSICGQAASVHADFAGRLVEAGLPRTPGIVAPAMHCVTAIPYVCAAEPGLVTSLDLPPVAGRAALSLARR